MSNLFSRLGSLRLTLGGMLFLTVTVLSTYQHPTIPLTWVAVPLALLAVNLLAAILSNPRFRQMPGLLVFHIGLLVIIILAGIDIMTRLSARVAIVEGQSFDPAEVVVRSRGPWHRMHLQDIQFIQGPVRVDYTYGLRRDEVQSRIWTGSTAERGMERLVSLHTPLEVSHYRLLPTANKGYAVILSWIDTAGATVTGAVHMPSFPLYEWKQRNQWTTPKGERLTLQLQFDSPVLPDRPWSLETASSHVQQLLITNAGGEVVLRRGDSVEMEGGRLRFDEVRLWLGYSIDYNVTLLWQFIAAMLSITGLGVHFWKKFAVIPAPVSQSGRLISEGGNSLHA